MNVDGEVVLMEDTEIYKNDTMGLRTVHENDRLYLREVPGADHLGFNDQWILDEIMPFLYEKVWPTNNK